MHYAPLSKFLIGGGHLFSDAVTTHLEMQVQVCAHHRVFVESGIVIRNATDPKI